MSNDRAILEAWDEDGDGQLSFTEQAKRYAGYWWNSFTQPVDTYTQLWRERVEGAPYQADPDGGVEILAADVATGAEYKDGKGTNVAGKILGDGNGRSLARIALILAGVGVGVYTLWTLRQLAPLAAATATDLGKATIQNAGGVGTLVKAVRS